ncbi:hypothetical protein PM082_014180 [Marasmius tenuissimus]|nr:hypothetical protein PM082_014180 [Marasmius tenuissimus]
MTILDTAQTIIIFGDSYSSEGDAPDTTWVKHLRKDLSSDVVMHNFSFPGATAEHDLADQLFQYLSKPRPNDELWSASPPNEVCYILFFGINDCGSNQECFLSDIVSKILEAAQRLYDEAAARNFLFIDVPPIDRSPSGVKFDCADIIERRVQTWNEEFRTQIVEFQANTATAKVNIFSLHQVLSKILDDPEDFDFTEDDSTTEGGAIWVDELHLTSEVHEIIAEQIRKAS